MSSSSGSYVSLGAGRFSDGDNGHAKAQRQEQCKPLFHFGYPLSKYGCQVLFICAGLSIPVPTLSQFRNGALSFFEGHLDRRPSSHAIRSFHTSSRSTSLEHFVTSTLVELHGHVFYTCTDQFLLGCLHARAARTHGVACTGGTAARGCPYPARTGYLGYRRFRPLNISR